MQLDIAYSGVPAKTWSNIVSPFPNKPNKQQSHHSGEVTARAPRDYGSLFWGSVKTHLYHFREVTKMVT